IVAAIAEPTSVPGAGEAAGRVAADPSASMPPLATPKPSVLVASLVRPGVTTTDEWSLFDADVIAMVLPPGLVALAVEPSAALMAVRMSATTPVVGSVMATGTLPSTETLMLVVLAGSVRLAGLPLILLPLPNEAAG